MMTGKVKNNMSAVEIFGAVIGLTALLALIVAMFFGINSAEKTENKKRELMNEISRYYKHRNEMFEKESEDNK